MGVRFVVGRAGTGRSRYCFDAIVASMRADPFGPAIYWLLPKQATFSAERELTLLSGMPAFCRARILSFELLGREVLAGCGGSAVPEISSIGRQMLLGHLLRSRSDELKFFRGVARQPGLAARLDGAFAEFERCGKSPAELAEVVEQLGTTEQEIESSPLAAKLHDFHLLYQAYRDALGDERVDPHRRLEQVLDCIADFAPLRGASVYVDDFRDFTDRERRMIVSLAKSAASIDITLLVDPASPTLRDPHHLPDELSLFHHTESQYRLLAIALQEAGVVLEPIVRLTEMRRTSAPALRSIERMFDSHQEPQVGSPPALELVEAPDRHTEVDAVARRIRQALREGLRLRQIGVLMRDIDDYDEIIAASFREHEIPYFVDRRRTASHHPLLQFTRAALQIIRHDWPHDAVMALLKSGLCGLFTSEVDELENYVLLHRIHGSAWASPEPWTYERRLTRGDRDEEIELSDRVDPSPMDRLRRQIADPFAPMAKLFRGKSPPTVRQAIVALFKLFEAFHVRDTVAQWIEQAIESNDPEQRGEHEQVWAELTGLFDQMADLLGDAAVAMADFIEVLDVGLEQFDLALPPPRVDQVLVGTVDRTRTPPLHTVYVLGLSEGQFPRVAREDPVLSDSERRSLRKQHLDLDPDSERRQLDERLLGYIGFTRASDRLVITRPTSNEGKRVEPSAFWRELTGLFPSLIPTPEQREADAPADRIATPRQLVTALMRWARKTGDACDSEQPWASLYQFLADHKTCDDPIGVMRYKAWRAVSYDNSAVLSPQIAHQLMPGALTASVTRIESFASCPFRHFARHHLRLEPRQEQDVTPMDLGTVYHGILERIVKRTLRDRRDWCEIEPKLNQEWIADFAEELGQDLRGEIMLSTARNQYLLKRIERTLEQVCATQREVLSRGQFRPAFAELNFGMESDGPSLPPLLIRTPNGREVRLQGKIDRVDLAAGSNEVAVIDYKMRRTTLNLSNVLYGLSLQLVTYLLVLQASGDKLFKKTVAPVAAFYAELLRGLEPVDHPDEAIAPSDPLFNLRCKPRGIFDGRFREALDSRLESGASEVVQCFVKQDGSIGKLDSSDAADPAAFAALLRYVEKRIGELADQMIDGVIEPHPFKLGTTSPCSKCDFRSVCRFDPGINRYLVLQPMKRKDVLEILAGKGGRDGE
jgi:ATP-dependent helicase/nuclease subunit B